MSKFTFINERFDYDEYTGNETNIVSKTTREFRAHHLESILDEMTDFLRGAGYHFDGHLDVVSYEKILDGEEVVEELDRQVAELNDDIRGQKVFAHMMQDIVKNPISFESEDDYIVNLNTMNQNFTVGSNDWDSSLEISDEIDLSSINEQFSFDFEQDSNETHICKLCNIPKSIMMINKCYDEKCPLRL